MTLFFRQSVVNKNLKSLFGSDVLSFTFTFRALPGEILVRNEGDVEDDTSSSNSSQSEPSEKSRDRVKSNRGTDNSWLQEIQQNKLFKKIQQKNEV